MNRIKMQRDGDKIIAYNETYDDIQVIGILYRSSTLWTVLFDTGTFQSGPLCVAVGQFLVLLDAGVENPEVIYYV